MKSLRVSSFVAAVTGALLLMGAGCISFNSGGNTATGNPNADGGVYKTANKGDQWAQKVAIATTGAEKLSINGVNVITIVQDPQDPAALYLGTTENGLLYTYDGGESWQRTAQLNRGRVNSIAVDAKNKCVIYATSEYKLLKSDDCSRTWNVVYVDTRKERLTTSVVVDFYDPRVVWLGNNSGDLLRSTDAGLNWVPVRTFENPIMKLALNAADSRKLFVATKDQGVWRTTDAGASWKNLRENYEDIAGANEFFDMTLGVSQPDTMVIATRYGLLHTTDAGDKWTPLELVTPPGTAQIYSVALDPKDTNGLYYGTASVFYKSLNGGINWVTQSLPTSRAATALLVDRSNQNVLYMGVTRFSK